MNISHFLIGLSFGLLTHGAASAQQDCLAQAAEFHSVNETVLRAMAWHESRNKAWAIGRNTNGTYDLGLMQINSIHLQELSRFGIGPRTLLDPCVSAYVGAWKHSKKIKKYGNTWAAVGAYHSETPALRNSYARQIHDLVYKSAAARK